MRRYKYFLITCVLGIIVVFLIPKTYSILSSIISANSNVDLAKFDIKINDVSLNSIDQNIISINNIVWENSHALSSTVAPSSKGNFTLRIDPNDVNVAFFLELNIVDSTTDPNKLLTVTSIELDGEEIVAQNGKYYVMYDLSEINNHTIKTVSVDVEWINDENNNNRDSSLDNSAEYIDIDFRVVQNYGQNIDGDL